MKYKDKKKNSTKSNILTTCATGIFALSMLSAGIVSNALPVNVYASSFVETSVTNGGFDSTSTSSFPKTASDWTVLSKNSGLKAGVISTKDEDFKNYYESYGLFYSTDALSHNEDSPNAFLINAEMKSGSYGIESPSFTLDANSYYAIRVDVRTDLKILDKDKENQIESFASMYLKLGDEIVSSKLNIRTTNQWSSYYFFVSTDFKKSSEAKVQLYLGSKEYPSTGAVMFDTLTCTKYTKEMFNNVVAKTSALRCEKYVCDESLENPEYKSKIDVTSNFFANSTFETLTNWTVKTQGDVSRSKNGIVDVSSSKYNPSITLVPTSPETNNIANDTSVLFINNQPFSEDDKRGASITYTSEEFTIERYKNYLFQFYVKTKDIAGDGVHASIIPTNEDYSTIKLTTISSSINPINNDWSLCSIYVQGNAYEDVKATLELGLGSVEEKLNASGSVFFDDLKVYEVSYEDYKNASTEKNSQKGAFTSESSSSSKIANSNFDLVADTAGISAPYAPAEWKVGNEKNTTSGIINNRYIGFNANGEYGSISWDAVGLTSNQSFIDKDNEEELKIANQNLLMLNTSTSGYQSYTSTEAELSASTLYKLSIDAKSLVDGAYIKVMFGENLINYKDIVVSSEFALQDLYILTPMTTSSITIELGLGNSTNLVYGYAFFDNIMLTDLTETDNTEYKPAEKLDELIEEDPTIRYVDMLTNYFNYDESSIDSKGLYASTSWKIEKQDGVNAGIRVVDETQSLLIASEKQNLDTKIESKFTYTLSETDYYKISFTLKTSEFKDLANSGAYFGFNQNTDEEMLFANVISKDEETVYEYYIKGADFKEITPYIGIKYENNNGTQQFVELTNFAIDKLTEAEFTVKQNEIKDKEDEFPNIVLIGEVKADDSSDDNTGSTTPLDPSALTWIIPTLITCLALVLAVIGMILKKVKKKLYRKGRKYTNIYDRETTIHKEILDKEVEDLRQEKINAVQTELTQVQEKLQSLEDKYKEDSSKEGANIEAEYKKFVRNRKRHAIKEQDLKQQIEYLKSDEYTEVALDEVIARHEKDKKRYSNY